MTQKEILKIDNAVAIRTSLDGGTTWSPYIYHQIPNIKTLVPVFQLGFAIPQPGDEGNLTHDYPYEDKLVILLAITDGHNSYTESFDIQDVSNQVTWTADEAGFLQAMADINEWLGSASIGGLTDGQLRATPIDVTIVPGATNETPDVIPLFGETFPYTFPASTYTSATLVVKSGTTIEFNGEVFSEGTYGFSSQSRFIGSFTLDNPSPATPDAHILVMS